jgi:hypothetical protein
MPGSKNSLKVTIEKSGASILVYVTKSGGSFVWIKAITVVLDGGRRAGSYVFREGDTQQGFVPGRPGLLDADTGSYLFLEIKDANDVLKAKAAVAYLKLSSRKSRSFSF